MPTASINAYMVVGPTKLKPSLRRAFDKARDSADLVGISLIVRGRGVLSGWKDQMKSANPPLSRSLMVAWALLMVARLFLWLRTMLESFKWRSTSESSKRATFSGSKSAKAVRKAGRLRKMVAHDSPAWKASKLKRS